MYQFPEVNLLPCLPPKHRFDEGVESTVHHVLDVTGFATGAEVLDHLVGLENVGPNLASPADFAFFGVGAVGLGLLLVLFDLVELGLEVFPSQLAVAKLGAFLGRANDDAGRKVFDNDGSFDLVDVLSAFAAGAGGGHFDVGVRDVDDDVVVNFRGDVDGRE